MNKNIIRKLFLYLFITISLIVSAPKNSSALDAGDLLSYFIRELTPYGRWTSIEPYGRVWEPRYTESGWRPYSQGHWIFSDEYGWTWRPRETWGEIPYHYGRWLQRGNSWYWVPDARWGPAWVDWRMSDDYIGWAPLPPDDDWDWEDEWRPRRTYYSYSSPFAYTFVPRRRFIEPEVQRYIIARDRNPIILRSAQDVTVYRTKNHRVRNDGPRREVVEKVVGRRVDPVRYVPRSIHGKELPAPPEHRATRRELRAQGQREERERAARIVRENERRPQVRAERRDDDRVRARPSQRVFEDRERERDQNGDGKDRKELKNKKNPSHKKHHKDDDGEKDKIRERGRPRH